MNNSPIQQIFKLAYDDLSSNLFLTSDQRKAAHAIIRCKTGSLGYNMSVCSECGHIVIRANSCRNRNCPNCQAVNREIWTDKRSAEVIDGPYYHLVFTLPHQLNPLIYVNQKILYTLLHKCCAETILELSADKKYLGAMPGIIQVLHTWNQELKYHIHMHCIISGSGITKDRKLRTGRKKFFIPVKVLRDKFKGKFLANLDILYKEGKLLFSGNAKNFESPENWAKIKNTLYCIDWCPYIKKTFNGFGNAIEYLGKYTNRIAISNSRIISVTDTDVTFSARGLKKGDPRRTVTISCEEFVKRYLLHVLPKGFQKIRYYGFLNNRMKSTYLKFIFQLQGHQGFHSKFTGLSKYEIIKKIIGSDFCKCPNCGKMTLRSSGIILHSSA